MDNLSPEEIELLLDALEYAIENGDANKVDDWVEIRRKLNHVQ